MLPCVDCEFLFDELPVTLLSARIHGGYRCEARLSLRTKTRAGILRARRICLPCTEARFGLPLLVTP